MQKWLPIRLWIATGLVIAIYLPHWQTLPNLPVLGINTPQPPIQHWIPNQPQATNARNKAGTFAPRRPKDDRQRTGKGIPYLVPACAFSTIGISTIRFPRKMVNTACHQFMPSLISDDASM